MLLSQLRQIYLEFLKGCTLYFIKKQILVCLKISEKNFNFKEASNVIKPLTGFNKEYSKVSNDNRKEKQLEVLEKLSKAISEQKTYLKVDEISLGDPQRDKA